MPHPNLPHERLLRHQAIGMKGEGTAEEDFNVLIIN
jgi:hypothetical protein